MPIATLHVKQEWIADQRRLWPIQNLFWQKAKRRSAQQLFFHTPRHRRNAKKEPQNAPVKKWRARLNRHARAARVSLFQGTGPVGIDEPSVSNRMTGMFVRQRLLQLVPALSQVLFVFKLRGQPYGIDSIPVLPSEPSTNPRAKTSSERRNPAVRHDVAAKRPD